MQNWLKKWMYGQGRCVQGNHTKHTHTGNLAYAFDFKLKPGTTRCWSHLGRVHSILATYPPRGTRLLYPFTRGWPDYSTTKRLATTPGFMPLIPTKTGKNVCVRSRIRFFLDLLANSRSLSAVVLNEPQTKHRSPAISLHSSPRPKSAKSAQPSLPFFFSRTKGNLSTAVNSSSDEPWAAQTTS